MQRAGVFQGASTRVAPGQSGLARLAQLGAYLRAPADPAALALFRILFGAMMLLSIARFWARGWIDTLYIEPALRFTYYGFSWLPRWPGWGMYAHFSLMALATLGVMLGAFYRVSIALFFLTFTYVELLDKSTYLNHYYLVSLVAFLLMWMPAHGMLSMDAWRKPACRAQAIQFWPYALLRMQLGLVYFFAGLAKLKTDWLVRGEPLHTWLQAHTDLPWVGAWMDERWLALSMSWAGALFDLSVFPLLLWRRTRPFAYAAVVSFHLATAQLFQIGVFPWVMIVCTTVFFFPSWPRRWLRAPAWSAPGAPSLGPRGARSSVAGGSPALRLVGTIALTLYFAFQLTFPLRGYLWPGNILWTEQGYRFAWNVMLIEKTGVVDFEVHDPATGRRWVESGRDYLTPLQQKMMSTQADMILEFAQWLAADYARRGIDGVEVYADSLVSLNGRRAQPFIDARVNLAAQQDSLAPKSWIVPLRTAP